MNFKTIQCYKCKKQLRVRKTWQPKATSYICPTCQKSDEKAEREWNKKHKNSR